MAMTFVVGNDGSGASLRALPHAARLAAACDAELLLVRVMNPWLDPDPTHMKDPSQAADVLAAAWQAELEEHLRLGGFAGSALVVRLQRNEDTSGALLRAARERDAALVAIHSRGTGVLRRALLGSVALGMLKSTHLPLLLTGQLVAEEPRAAGEKFHVLLTSDGSPASNRLVPTVHPLLEALDGRASLLRVVEPRSGRADPAGEITACERQLEVLRAALPAALPVQMVAEAALPGESTADAILRIAASSRADAIAMASHGHSLVRQAIAGSTALGVLRKSPLPLILVRS